MCSPSRHTIMQNFHLVCTAHGISVVDRRDARSRRGDEGTRRGSHNLVRTMQCRPDRPNLQARPSGAQQMAMTGEEWRQWQTRDADPICFEMLSGEEAPNWTRNRSCVGKCRNQHSASPERSGTCVPPHGPLFQVSDGSDSHTSTVKVP